MEEIKSFFRKYRCYATVLLIIANIVWFLYMEIHGDINTNEGMLSCGAMLSDAIEKGNYSQLITAIFVHFDIQHIANNMLLLLVMGAMLECHMGSIRFLIIYFLGGIGGNVISAYWHMSEGNIVLSAGASGAIFGIVGGFLAALILNKGKIQDMTARKLIVFVVLSLYQGFASQGIDNAAHVGGFICGFVVAAICEFTRKDRYRHES